MTQAQHHPDPEFISRLENQLTAEYRRQERLGLRHRQRTHSGRWLRAVGFMLAGLLLGYASLTTAQRLDRAETLEQLQLRAEANLQVATRRAEVNRQILETFMRRWAAGEAVASNSVILSTRADVAEAETALLLAELDVEELDAGGDPSRDDVSAPRVGDRDFFSARLQIERDAIAERARQLEEVIEFTEVRVNAGVEVSRNLMPLTVERERLAIASARIDDTLALRQSFLDGGIDAEEAELRHRLLLIDARRQTAQAELELLRAQDELLQRRYAAGLVSNDEAALAERDMLQAEAAVQLAEMEIALVTRRLEL